MFRCQRILKINNQKYIYYLSKEISIILTFNRLDDFQNEINKPDNQNENFFQNVSKGCINHKKLEMLKLLCNNFSYNISFENSILLFIAIDQKNDEIINFLLEHEINIKQCTDVLFNALPFINEKIINKLAEINNFHTNNTDQFFNCVLQGNYHATKLLVENKIDIHYNDDAALRLSIINGHDDITKLLVQNNANINLEGDKNAVYLAIKHKKYGIIPFLLENGADINIINNIKVIPNENIGLPNLFIQYQIDLVKIFSIMLEQ